jgi:hypothetical protein
MKKKTTQVCADAFNFSQNNFVGEVLSADAFNSVFERKRANQTNKAELGNQGVTEADVVCM